MHPITFDTLAIASSKAHASDAMEEFHAPQLSQDTLAKKGELSWMNENCEAAPWESFGIRMQMWQWPSIPNKKTQGWITTVAGVLRTAPYVNLGPWLMVFLILNDFVGMPGVQTETTRKAISASRIEFLENLRLYATILDERFLLKIGGSSFVTTPVVKHFDNISCIPKKTKRENRAVWSWHGRLPLQVLTLEVQDRKQLVRWRWIENWNARNSMTAAWSHLGFDQKWAGVKYKPQV